MFSKILLLLSVFIAPDDVKKRIDSILFNFIWSNSGKGVERVKRSTLIQSYKKGGIGMLDVDTMQKSFLLSWMNKVRLSSDSYTLIPRMLYRPFITGLNFEKLNCKGTKLKHEITGQKLPLFYKRVLRYVLCIMDRSRFSLCAPICGGKL